MFYVSHQTELQRHFVVNAIECSVIEWCEIDFECCMYGRLFFLTLFLLLSFGLKINSVLFSCVVSTYLLAAHILVLICVPLRPYIVYQVDRQENMIITMNNERERETGNFERRECLLTEKDAFTLCIHPWMCIVWSAVVDNYGNMSGFRSIIRAHISKCIVESVSTYQL